MEDDIASINKKKTIIFIHGAKDVLLLRYWYNELFDADVTDFGCEDVREIGKILQRASHSLKISLSAIYRFLVKSVEPN